MSPPSTSSVLASSETQPIKSCAACNTKVGKMRRCSRCLTVAYCTKSCQLSHWKTTHKKICALASTNANMIGKDVFGNMTLPNVPADLAAPQFGFRNVLIDPIPNDLVEAACFCCGMLLLRKGPSNSKLYMVSDPFVEFAQLTNDELYDRFSMLPYPAEHMFKKLGCDKGEINSFRVGPGVLGPSACLGACLHCATQLNEARGKDAKGKPTAVNRFLAAIARFTNVTNMSTFPDGMEGGLSPMECRMITPLQLFANPDLSKGKSSIAGLMTSGNKQKIPFNFGSIESIAFPLSFTPEKKNSPCAAWSTDHGLTLMHYMLARLYSVSPHWRDNADYVMFSLHRLAAFGNLPLTMLENLAKDAPHSAVVNGSIMPEPIFIAIPPFGRDTLDGQDEEN